MPYLGLLQEGNSNLQTFLETAQENGYNLAVTPLNYMEIPLDFQRPITENEEKIFTYSDLVLNPDTWNSKIINILSDNIDCDSADLYIRQNSEKLLKRDISWSAHLQYAGYTMLKLKNGNVLNLARIATAHIKGAILIHVPLFSKKFAHAFWRQDINTDYVEDFDETSNNSWQWWNKFRWVSDFNSKVKVVLEFNEGDVPTDEIICRWLGEPLEAVLVPSTLFVKNRHNYPVLPKAWQYVLKCFIQSHVNMIVSSSVGDQSLKLYAEYLNSLRNSFKDNNQLQSYEDALEIPLQPLYDNLDCYTYELFEKDPIKYKLYQDAIEAALIDRVPETNMNEKSVIMVLGAGRGPLVRSVLNASANSKRKVKIYVIEKNPNAIRTLHGIFKKLWHNKNVHLISKDMREFTPPEKADIIVSELLGSFGDNELSPECLDCAQRLLKADGISIPCKSTSFINPLMSSKLYNAIRNLARSEQFGRDKQATYLTHAEGTYVVLLKNIYNIDEPKALFEFVHPNNKQQPIDNTRYKSLKFHVKLDCVLNGIGGYFEAVLYKDIILSINPATHTLGMVSWFPMYFPFAEPINVKRGQTIEIHFWRCANETKVWYEWCLSEPITTHIHNHGGRSASIYSK